MYKYKLSYITYIFLIVTAVTANTYRPMIFEQFKHTNTQNYKLYKWTFKYNNTKIVAYAIATSQDAAMHIILNKIDYSVYDINKIATLLAITKCSISNIPNGDIISIINLIQE